MFETESDTYEFDCIRNCLFIRSLRERIQDSENQCLVLEWMDHTLWDTKDESLQAKTRIFKTVARSCLNGLKAFSDMDGQGVSVHADLNPNNILITGFSSATPVVKVADLGCSSTVYDPPRPQLKLRPQGDAIRAPEIWKGEGLTPAADIWSLGVSLAHWMAAKAIFGKSGRTVKTNLPQEVNEAGWSIAKLHRLRDSPLRGPIQEPWAMDWAVAVHFIESDLAGLSTSLRETLVQTGVSSELIDFIEYLLVVEPTERPSADDALAHPFLAQGL
ncbi:hypothetical protein EG328_002832 [Venturia inaequalis]|nr:hypothetical protein EG328_002832 [Venturia inaequalis]